jgi:hypothetical protein
MHSRRTSGLKDAEHSVGLVNKNTVLFWQIDASSDPPKHEGFYGCAGLSAVTPVTAFHGNISTT